MPKLHGVEIKIGSTRKDQHGMTWRCTELDEDHKEEPFRFKAKDGHHFWFRPNGKSNLHGIFDVVLQPNKPKQKAKA